MTSENQLVEITVPTETPVSVSLPPTSRTIVIPDSATMKDVEKIYILDTLNRNGGNKTKTAYDLGITIKTLYNKLHSYGFFETKTKGEVQ
jgi:DNA-binding NtrC family response regulator